jgi:predicted component of type VI protein secretion system
MSHHDSIEQLVRRTLDLLEAPAPLQSDPSFLPRLLRRIDAPPERYVGVVTLLRPALLVLLLLVNLVAAWTYVDSGIRSQHLVAQRELIDILAGERIGGADRVTPSVTE